MDLIGLIPSFGNLLWTLAAFITALSVIVAIHEYGHYIVGRWSGIHAEVFSLGFGPRLVSWRDKRGTLWQIAALPLGGYVKFLGDEDPASAGADRDGIAAMSADERRRTMHGAPLWARAATVAAGPLFNFALSILVFAVVMIWQGQASDPLTVAEVKPLPTYASELAPGDRILAIDGKDTPNLAGFGDFVDALPLEGQLDYRVLRDGRERTVIGPYPYPPLVSSVAPKSAARQAGIEIGDVITAVDGTPVNTFEDIRVAVSQTEGAPLTLSLWRAGEVLDVTLSPKPMDVPAADGGFEKRYLIGITGGLFFEPQTESPGALRALGMGVSQTWFVIEQSLSGLYHMIAGNISSCNLSGPVGIADASATAASQGADNFIWFIAVLSTAVGLLNLFPVPVLDGGHLVFFAYEAVAGKPPSERALRALMTTGMTLILALMSFALITDFIC